MNALVGIRANQAGFYSPSEAQRRNVAQELASHGTPRYPKAVRDYLKSLATQKQQGEGSETIAQTGLDQELSRDAFLQLLVTQLQHQDPLEPVNNEDMIAQLAQFSSLEQMNNLNDRFEDLSGNLSHLNFISASGLVGRTISGTNAEGASVLGPVEGVQLEDGAVTLTVDGQSVALSSVSNIV